MSEDVNPYETPKVNTELGSVVPSAVVTNQYEMVNTRFIALLSKALLGVYAAVFSFVAVWNFKLAYEFEILDEWSGFGFLSYEDMVYIEESGEMFLFYSCAIVIAIWTSKSMRNAWAMRRSGNQPTISPGWAVGWYLIPIASLWKPLQAMFEINKNSLSRPDALTVWIGTWWFLWLSGIISNIVLAVRSEDVDVYFCLLAGLCFLTDVFAGLCLIKIITEITKAQMEEYRSRNIIKKPC